jgi:hypothetical protein
MEPDDPDGRKRALLSLRSAFVLTLTLLVTIAAGGLLYAAYHSTVLAVLGAGGAFAAALKLINDMIELRLAVTSRRGLGSPSRKTNGYAGSSLRIRLAALRRTYYSG